MMNTHALLRTTDGVWIQLNGPRDAVDRLIDDLAARHQATVEENGPAATPALLTPTPAQIPPGQTADDRGASLPQLPAFPSNPNAQATRIAGPDRGQLKLAKLARIFQLLADSTRSALVNQLNQSSRSVTELCMGLSGQSQPSVSHHLALLRSARIVESDRAGKFNYYSLTPLGHRVAELLNQLRDYARAAGETDVDLLAKPLADASRLMILLTLKRDGWRSVSSLVKALPDQSQPSVSHHLGTLRDAGFVINRREGRFIHYALAPRGEALVGAFLKIFRTAAKPQPADEQRHQSSQLGGDDSSPARPSTQPNPTNPTLANPSSEGG